MKGGVPCPSNAACRRCLQQEAIAVGACEAKAARAGCTLMQAHAVSLELAGRHAFLCMPFARSILARIEARREASEGDL